MPLLITKSSSEQSACPHIARMLRLFWIWNFMDISIFMDYWMDFRCNFTAHPDLIMWYCPVGSFPSLKKESPIFRNRSKNFSRFQIGYTRKYVIRNYKYGWHDSQPSAYTAIVFACTFGSTPNIPMVRIPWRPLLSAHHSVWVPRGCLVCVSLASFRQPLHLAMCYKFYNLSPCFSIGQSSWPSAVVTDEKVIETCLTTICMLLPHKFVRNLCFENCFLLT